MMMMLSHRSDSKPPAVSQDTGPLATSFAQLDRIKCFHCNKKGHMKRDFPELRDSGNDSTGRSQNYQEAAPLVAASSNARVRAAARTSVREAGVFS